MNYFGIRQILDEMIYNVCENAVKYNVENGRVSVWVGNTLDGPKLQCLIPESVFHKNIMRESLSVSTVWTRVIQKKRGGTGLGLSIVKHGALLHGAKVSVDSIAGTGDTDRDAVPQRGEINSDFPYRLMLRTTSGHSHLLQSDSRIHRQRKRLIPAPVTGNNSK